MQRSQQAAPQAEARKAILLALARFEGFSGPHSSTGVGFRV